MRQISAVLIAGCIAGTAAGAQVQEHRHPLHHRNSRRSRPVVAEK